MAQAWPDNVLPLFPEERAKLNHPAGANQLTSVRTSDPETSHHAKLDAYPRSGTRKQRALLAFWRQHALRCDGLTDYELSVILSCLRGSASKVRGLLEQGNWVRCSDRLRPTDTGSRAIVWVLTGDAQRFLERLYG